MHGKTAGSFRPGREQALDPEQERWQPTLEEELQDCLDRLRQNRQLFDWEVDGDLIDQRIYERQALLCRYRYLQNKARALGLRAFP